MSLVNDDQVDALAAKFYPDATAEYRSTLAPDIARLRDASGLSAEDAEARLVATAEFFQDAGISSRDAARLHAIIMHRSITPHDATELDRQETETLKMIRERYPNDGERRMETVREFIEWRPMVSEILTAANVATHAEIVGALLENANNLRIEPRDVTRSLSRLRTPDGRFASDKKQPMHERFYGEAER